MRRAPCTDQDATGHWTRYSRAPRGGIVIHPEYFLGNSRVLAVNHPGICWTAKLQRRHHLLKFHGNRRQPPVSPGVYCSESNGSAGRMLPGGGARPEPSEEAPVTEPSSAELSPVVADVGHNGEMSGSTQVLVSNREKSL